MHPRRVRAAKRAPRWSPLSGVKNTARGVSRGLTTEPGASPNGAKDASVRRLAFFFRPFGAVPFLLFKPTAYAVGYILTPLRGWPATHPHDTGAMKSKTLPERLPKLPDRRFVPSIPHPKP